MCYTGHEFEAIFLSLFEPSESNDFCVKSLFNPYVFNTVITRARTCVVAVGKPKEILQFERKMPTNSDNQIQSIQCWHEYLKLCSERKRLYHCDSKEIDEELRKYVRI